MYKLMFTILSMAMMLAYTKITRSIADINERLFAQLFS